MENEPILSIIVPSYNTSKYVDECLPTFIDERLFGKVKVLLIDDGATDDTAEKIKPYVDKYPQLFEFYHKENGGHGSVINYAVHKLIKTKYFKVVDGDDWVDSDELYWLVVFLNSIDVDVVINDMTLVSPMKIVDNKGFIGGNPASLKSYNISIHTLTYKTDLFIKNNILLSEGVFYEDNEYDLFPFIYAKSISHCDRNVYKYRIANESQSVSKTNKIKHLADSEKIIFSILKKNVSEDLNNNKICDLRWFFKDTLESMIASQALLLAYESSSYKDYKIKIHNFLNAITSIYPKFDFSFSKHGKRILLISLFNFRFAYFLRRFL